MHQIHMHLIPPYAFLLRNAISRLSHATTSDAMNKKSNGFPVTPPEHPGFPGFPSTVVATQAA